MKTNPRVIFKTGENPFQSSATLAPPPAVPSPATHPWTLSAFRLPAGTSLQHLRAGLLSVTRGVGQFCAGELRQREPPTRQAALGPCQRRVAGGRRCLPRLGHLRPQAPSRSSRQLGGATVCPRLLPHTPGSEAHNCVIDSGTVGMCGAGGPPARSLCGDREHAATRRVTGIRGKDGGAQAPTSGFTWLGRSPGWTFL